MLANRTGKLNDDDEDDDDGVVVVVHQASNHPFPFSFNSIQFNHWPLCVCVRFRFNQIIYMWQEWWA